MDFVRFPLLVAVLALAACSARNRPARADKDIEAASVVAVHPDIDNRIRVVKYSTHRTPDGRLAISVVLSSSMGKDHSLILTTDWLDDNGAILERSTPRQQLIPSGGTIVVEEESWTTEATRFTLQVRSASTKRAS